MKDENGTIEIGVIYSEGKVVTKEDLSSEMIEVRTLPLEVPLATVRVSRSITINMGDFQSVRLGVEVELPTPVEQLNDAYLTAKNFADMRLNKEAAEVRETRKG